MVSAVKHSGGLAAPLSVAVVAVILVTVFALKSHTIGVELVINEASAETLEAVRL